MGRVEELQYGKPFPEVGLNGYLNGLTRRIRNQAPHTGQLAELGLITPGSGTGHHPDGIEGIHVFPHGSGDLFLGPGPDIADPLISFLGSQQAPPMLLFNCLHLLLSCSN